MKGEKITVLQDLNNKKIQFIFDRHRLFKGIFRAMVGPKGLQREDFKTAIKNTVHTFVRDKAEVPSLQNVVFDSRNLGEGLNYDLNQKSLNYLELLSPFMVNRVLTSLGR